MKVLVIGKRGGTNIGGCFERAAVELGFDVRLLETRLATEAPLLLQKFNWWFRGKRPTWLGRFGRMAVDTCSEWEPNFLIATGIAPLDETSLRKIGSLDIVRINYLTDDPWNPAHRALWFLEALPNYDAVFSPRQASLGDLFNIGCPEVHYLPFAYAPELHYPAPPASSAERERFSTDVVFVGSGDPDRVPYIAALMQQDFKFALYGSFWERFSATRSHSRGQIDAPTLCKATSGAKIALCLVRRANRDGHVMRSFEVPAIGTCMLAEDTQEHRELFGDEGERVLYFQTKDEMVRKARWLLDHPADRRRMAKAAHDLIIGGRHTYKDRLVKMLKLAHSLDSDSHPEPPTATIDHHSQLIHD